MHSYDYYRERSSFNNENLFTIYGGDDAFDGVFELEFGDYTVKSSQPCDTCCEIHPVSFRTAERDLPSLKCCHH